MYFFHQNSQNREYLQGEPFSESLAWVHIFDNQIKFFKNEKKRIIEISNNKCGKHFLLLWGDGKNDDVLCVCVCRRMDDQYFIVIIVALCVGKIIDPKTSPWFWLVVVQLVLTASGNVFLIFSMSKRFGMYWNVLSSFILECDLRFWLLVRRLYKLGYGGIYYILLQI